jgi:hypothetical protein
MRYVAKYTAFSTETDTSDVRKWIGTRLGGFQITPGILKKSWIIATEEYTNIGGLRKS